MIVVKTCLSRHRLFFDGKTMLRGCGAGTLNFIRDTRMSFLTSTPVKYAAIILALVWGVIYLIGRNDPSRLEPGPEVHDQGVITRIYGFEPETENDFKMRASGLHTLRRVRTQELKGGIAYEIAAKNHPETLVYKIDSARAPDLSVGDEVELMHMEFPTSRWSREVMVLYITPKETE